jgi:hypothetical protein
MKKVTKSLIALLALAAVMPACKKGDEDPSISLRSRKGRVAGEWKVKSFEENTTSTSTYYNSPTFVNTTTESTMITDGAASSKKDFSTTNAYPNNTGLKSSTDNLSGTATTFTYTFEKDGTWKAVKEIKWTSANGSQTDYDFFTGATTTTPYTSVINNTTKWEMEGTWQFLGKNKQLDEKNKESMSLSTTKMTTTETNVVVSTGTNNGDSETDVTTETYGANEMTSVWHISMLKNKEMMVDAIIENSNGGTVTEVDASGSETDNKSDFTTTGTTKLTLSQE